MQAKDVMTQNVITATPDQSVLSAARAMLAHRISGLPVVDKDGELVGIVTEGDFLRRTEIGTQRRRPKWLEFIVGPGRPADEYVHTSGRKIEEIMTPDPYTVVESDPIEDVVEAMQRRQIKRLPVVRNGQVVGIVSRANLMQALASLASTEPASSGPDWSIRNQILAALGQQHWAPNVNVIVKDGIVELRGAITDERERQALVVLTENVAGVKQIHDHLVWVEPMSGVALLSAEDEAKEEEAKEKEVRPSIAVADRMKSARPEGWQETLP